MKAKYTTKATALKNGLNIAEFSESMSDYDLRISVQTDYIEVIEDDKESCFYGERVDVANYVLYYDDTCKEWTGGLLLAEMNSSFEFSDGTQYSTCMDDGEDMEINGYPLHVERLMRQARKH